MLTPRWRKLFRDLATERGRALLMVSALALSIMAVGTVLGAFAIMTREITRNYLGTHPASAALELRDGVDHDLVAAVRRRPEIAEAEAGEIVLGRAQVGNDWIPLLLFVVDDFNAMRLNTFARATGAWPPPDGSMLVERSAVPILKAGERDTVLVKTPHGSPLGVPIAGLVHDPGLAPAWQEREGYGYITRATLARLGESPRLGELRVTFRANATDIAGIERAANELAYSLRSDGHAVTQVRIPPPNRHPHQSQMMGVMFLMLSFSSMALVLSAILVATSLAALLARQVREIGVMKTIGARSRQLAALYALLIAVLGITAVIVALPIGVLGARALANMSASMLNLSIASFALPWWVFAVEIVAGILVPCAVAAVPIVRASRITVRDAMDGHGASEPARHVGFTGLNRIMALALRNAYRRRTRAALTLALLAAGGAMFMTALNISRGWDRITDRVYENRSYDVEIRLNQAADIAEQLRAIPGVRTAEAWGYERTAFWQPHRVDIVRTYPDGSHGSLILLGPPPATNLVHFPLMAGRWLRPGDTDAVVLNHNALAQAPRTAIGDHITLSLAGHATTWRVVGIVEEVGAAGVAYVSREAFEGAANSPGRVRMLRVATNASSPAARTETIRAIDRQLQGASVSIEAIIPLSVLRTAMGDHIVVLIRMLLAMAALMATVGALGLASTMGTNVLERTREIGVMKTIGATPAQVGRLVISEALFVAAASWLAAVALALPLSALVGKTVGMLAFRLRLPLIVDTKAALAWLAMVSLVAIVATLLPARRAARMSVWGALGRV